MLILLLSVWSFLGLFIGWILSQEENPKAVKGGRAILLLLVLGPVVWLIMFALWLTK